MTKPGKIRTIAICVVRNGDSIFVYEGYDHSKAAIFYRPLGGTIEFGERSFDTVRRELREEIEARVTNLRYLGTLESIFTHERMQGHEIVLVYEGDFEDAGFYNQAIVTGREDDGETFTAKWVPLEDFRQGKAPLYPDGLLELLERE
jgi:8-oxo-dGTP pyrophosphatase MutT (NUDIX family)